VKASEFNKLNFNDVGHRHLQFEIPASNIEK